MSIAKIQSSYLNGEVIIPPSKSVAHRAMICSYLAGGGNVFPIADSNDMKAMNQVIRALNNNEEIIDCIESGNTLRFMIPVIAALGRKVTFVGSGRLPYRPIDEYLKLLPKHGIKYTYNEKLPLSIEGKLTSGIFEIAGDISSQYITGLLLALPLLDGDSRIVLTTKLQSKSYVDITIKVLKDYGIEIEETEEGYFVKGNQKFRKIDYCVESDWSQATFFLAAGALNGNITLKGLDLESKQGDKEVINILKRFGAKIDILQDKINVKKSHLKGIIIDAEDIPDAVPTLAVVAAVSEGTTIIEGIERLRYKESDRIESTVSNLKNMGVNIKADDNKMIIEGGKLHGSEINGFNDHRIVMAFSIAALVSNGETTISDAHAINKTYPNFFEDYNRIGGKAIVINN